MNQLMCQLSNSINHSIAQVNFEYITEAFDHQRLKLLDTLRALGAVGSSPDSERYRLVRLSL
ncbi:hypothetical protein YC2023_058105 [Brassica napus]